MTTKAVAAGIKTAITSIDVLASANAGDSVIVDVYTKNLTTEYLYIAVIGTYDSNALSFQFDYLLVAPGETVDFRAVFTMPNKSVNINVSSWWWNGTQWVQDDSGSASISLGGWTRLSSPITAALSPSVAAEWSKIGNPVTASLSPALAAEWTKLSSPVTAAVEVSPIPGGWAKIGASVNGQINPGFEVPPDYKLVLSNVYPDGKTYSGPAQRCVASFTFLPSNFPGANWFIQSLIVNHLASKVTDSGEKLLDMKLYENGMSYLLVLEATNTPTPYVALAPAAWMAIIVGAFVLALAIVIAVTINVITDFIYKSPAAGISAGVIVLAIAGMGLVGLAIYKGTSVKGAITGK